MKTLARFATVPAALLLGAALLFGVAAAKYAGIDPVSRRIDGIVAAASTPSTTSTAPTNVVAMADKAKK